MPYRTVTFSVVAVLAIIQLTGCVDAQTSNAGIDQSKPDPNRVSTVTVDLQVTRATVADSAYGMHTSVYDNALHDQALPARLAEAGITLLRYPGGGYSDNYHWSTHSMTPWSSVDQDGKITLGTNTGYLASGSDFGSYVAVLDSTATQAMVTVNYGSNLTSDGPGEPKEAAAWVAYANGLVDDDTNLGLDSTGHDWKTVGYWATLRATSPLASDDGYNFLRINRPAPIGVHYWEIGNEVFGNGYYNSGGMYEGDLHVPYDGSLASARAGHALLSPTTYGKGVVEYAEAMKAVDPSIAIGAVLNTLPLDYSWGPTWNSDVLTECGKIVDFVMVHYYPDGGVDTLMKTPNADVSRIITALKADFTEHAYDNAEKIEITVTELGPKVGAAKLKNDLAVGLFAAEAYLTFMEYGVTNLDWLELHAGGFLSERDSSVGPAFRGIQLAHELAAPGDDFVKTATNTVGITSHAAKRTDGSVGLLLVNLNSEAIDDLQVAITGATLPTAATKRVYQRDSDVIEGDGTISEATQVADVGNDFTLTLPPRSATLLEFP